MLFKHGCSPCIYRIPEPLSAVTHGNPISRQFCCSLLPSQRGKLSKMFVPSSFQELKCQNGPKKCDNLTKSEYQLKSLIMEMEIFKSLMMEMENFLFVMKGFLHLFGKRQKEKFWNFFSFANYQLKLYF